MTIADIIPRDVMLFSGLLIFHAVMHVIFLRHMLMMVMITGYLGMLTRVYFIGSDYWLIPWVFWFAMLAMTLRSVMLYHSKSEDYED